jgi:hypothetical protein
MRRLLLASLALFDVAAARAQPQPTTQPLGLPDVASRKAIHMAQVIGRNAGEKVWKGMAAAPFDVLLIEQERETLFCSPTRKDFARRRWDPITRCWTQTRARTQDPDSFGETDVFGNGRPIILVGVPPTKPDDLQFWTALMVHEHFHQLQDSKPWMGAEVKLLGPVFGGGTGANSWALVYPFPYKREDVNAVFDKMAAAALDFLQAKTAEEGSNAASDYLAQRAALEHLVSPTDWRYFEEQMWTEGIARWTQAPVMDAYARMSQDPGWRKAAEGMHKARIVSLNAVRRQGIKMWKRSAIYEVGPVEAEIAAMRCKDWKAAYWAHHFTMGPLLTGKC